jgi:hypothetical protein
MVRWVPAARSTAAIPAPCPAAQRPHAPVASTSGGPSPVHCRCRCRRRRRRATPTRSGARLGAPARRQLCAQAGDILLQLGQGVSIRAHVGSAAGAGRALLLGGRRACAAVHHRAALQRSAAAWGEVRRPAFAACGALAGPAGRAGGVRGSGRGLGAAWGALVGRAGCRALGEGHGWLGARAARRSGRRRGGCRVLPCHCDPGPASEWAGRACCRASRCRGPRMGGTEATARASPGRWIAGCGRAAMLERRGAPALPNSAPRGARAAHQPAGLGPAAHPRGYRADPRAVTRPQSRRKSPQAVPALRRCCGARRQLMEPQARSLPPAARRRFCQRPADALHTRRRFARARCRGWSAGWAWLGAGGSWGRAVFRDGFRIPGLDARAAREAAGLLLWHSTRRSASGARSACSSGVVPGAAMIAGPAALHARGLRPAPREGGRQGDLPQPSPAQPSPAHDSTPPRPASWRRPAPCASPGTSIARQACGALAAPGAAARPAAARRLQARCCVPRPAMPALIISP